MSRVCQRYREFAAKLGGKSRGKHGGHDVGAAARLRQNARNYIPEVSWSKSDVACVHGIVLCLG